MREQRFGSHFEATCPNRLLKASAGYVFFAVGFVGLFLPILPTTIFWIIAAVCFAKSSPAMYRRILSWPRVGSAIGDFICHGVIRPASKRIALGGMAAGGLLTIVVNVDRGPALAAVLGLSIAAGYVLTRPSSVERVAPGSMITDQK